jgi:hypothetical protein
MWRAAKLRATSENSSTDIVGAEQLIKAIQSEA